jgi:hypothetical protein
MYEWSIRKHQAGTLLGLAVAEMAASGQDSWLSRVRTIQSLLDIPIFSVTQSEAFVSHTINSRLKSQFERFYLDEINRERIGTDGLNHNKLRFYSSFKGSFKSEPYISNINNRNQRKWISRLRTSSHRLEIELGRYNATAVADRHCQFCLREPTGPHGSVGDESHFLHDCASFSDERRVLFIRMSVIMPSFSSMTREAKIRTLLCPATARAAKLVNKYICLMFELRDQIEEARNPTV